MRNVILGILAHSESSQIHSFVRSLADTVGDDWDVRLSIVIVAEPAREAELTGLLASIPGIGARVLAVDPPAEEALHFSVLANRLVSEALAEGADLILAEPSIILFDDTIREMLAVLPLDHMIGFVSPRLRPEPAEGSTKARQVRGLAQRLPPITYVPAAVRSCLLIRRNILQNFAAFDPRFAPGGHEATDLMMRANTRGYRAVLANRAVALQKGPDAVEESEETKALLAGAPWHEPYTRWTAEYQRSAESRAFALISALNLTDRPTIAIDFSNVDLKRNGTTEHGTNLLRAFARLFAGKYRIAVICDPDLWDFLAFGQIPQLERVPTESEETYAAVVRFSQPFDLQRLVVAARRGAAMAFLMLDTIAYDCLYLRARELHDLWQFVLEHSGAVLYNSSFTQNQFNRRFFSGDRAHHLVSMPSTEIDDYKPTRPETDRKGESLLVVGNKYAHKAVRETVVALRTELPDESINVLGVKMPELPDGASFESGALDDQTVAQLFAGAKAVIFPSHYEGFGLPIMHALANQKPVFVRDLPVFEEIKGRTRYAANVHLFRTFEELAGLLKTSAMAWSDSEGSASDVGWDRAARELESAIAQAIQSVTFDAIVRRLQDLALLEEALASRPKIENLVRRLDQEAREHRERMEQREREHREQSRQQMEQREREHREQMEQHREQMEQRQRKHELQIATERHIQNEKQNKIDHLQAELASMLNSTSWRMTAPIRRVKRALSRDTG